MIDPIYLKIAFHVFVYKKPIKKVIEKLCLKILAIIDTIIATTIDNKFSDIKNKMYQIIFDLQNIADLGILTEEQRLSLKYNYNSILDITSFNQAGPKRKLQLALHTISRQLLDCLDIVWPEKFLDVEYKYDVYSIISELENLIQFNFLTYNEKILLNSVNASIKRTISENKVNKKNQ